MERLASGRPTTSGRPISSVTMPRTIMTARPITQQGLTGLRPIQSSYGGSNRIYRDKRYYLTMIQKQSNATRDEIAKLMKDTKDFKLSSKNLPQLQRNAQELAKTLSEKQEELTVLNMMLDLHLSKTNIDELQDETRRLEQECEVLTKNVEQTFERNSGLEKQLTKIKYEIGERDRIVQDKVDGLPPDEKEEYFQLIAQNEQFMAKIADVQAEIKRRSERINDQKRIIAQSAIRQQYFEKLLNIERLKLEKGDLEKAKSNTKTPEQERQLLLERLKSEKADIEALTKEKTNLEQHISVVERQCVELDRELQGKDTARWKKQKELRERGEHMEKFISEYDEKARELREKHTTTQKHIEMALEFIAAAEAESNLRDLNIRIDDTPDDSIEGWRNKYTVLKKNLERGELVLKKYDLEKNRIRLLSRELNDERSKYENPEERLQELQETKAELMGHRAALQATLDSTNSAITEAQRILDDEYRMIEENEDISRLIRMDKEIEEMEKKKEALRTQLEEESKNEEYNQILDNVSEIIKKRNEQLIQKLKNKTKK